MEKITQKRNVELCCEDVGWSIIMYSLYLYGFLVVYKTQKFNQSNLSTTNTNFENVAP